jgi:hypothetical protein
MQLDPVYSPGRQLHAVISDCSFTKSTLKDEVLFQTFSNSKLEVQRSVFEDNYSQGRGSVFRADYKSSLILVGNSTFRANVSQKGGVAYAQLFSHINFTNSVFEKNAAELGGIAFVNSNGQVSF